jgi:hypothetical protein
MIAAIIITCNAENKKLTMNIRTRSYGRKEPEYNDITSEMLLSSEEKKTQKLLEEELQLVIKQRAFRELIQLRATNGGKSQYGDIASMVKKYHNMGYSYVTRVVLGYMLTERQNMSSSGDIERAPIEEMTISDIALSETDSAYVSMLNGESSTSINMMEFQNNEVPDEGGASFTKLIRNYESKDLIHTRKKNALLEAWILFKAGQDLARSQGKIVYQMAP